MPGRPNWIFQEQNIFNKIYFLLDNIYLYTNWINTFQIVQNSDKDIMILKSFWCSEWEMEHLRFWFTFFFISGRGRGEGRRSGL